MQAHVYANEKDRKRFMAETGYECAVPLVVDVPIAHLSAAARQRLALWRYPLLDPPVIRFDLRWRPAWFPWGVAHLPHTPAAWEHFADDYVRLERERIEQQLAYAPRPNRLGRAALVLGSVCAAWAWWSGSLLTGTFSLLCFAVWWRSVRHADEEPSWFADLTCTYAQLGKR